MKALHFECVGGASGDMILGALADLGVDPGVLRRQLAALPIGRFELRAEPFGDAGLRGTRVTVDIPSPARDAKRNLADVTQLINGTRLPEPVKAMSVSVFTRLAEAEGRAHGTTPDRVHFHEVGAEDALVDIVGSCLGLHLLGAEQVAVGPFPAGRGVIRCAHGVFPNPAPATVELLKGFPVLQTDEEHELVTPTGAAILTAWKTADAPPPGSRIVNAGYGFGHHKLAGRPNLLRATLLDAAGGGAGRDTCLVLECNLDDTTPELVGVLAGRLMEAGALDAFTTPVQMKKQRPGVLLTVLCAPAAREGLLDLIFRESTTFGVREYAASRTVLDRRIEEVETAYGRVRIKVGRWRDEDVTRSPEMEDCVCRAAKAGVPVRAVYEAALAAAPNPDGNHAAK